MLNCISDLIPKSVKFKDFSIPSFDSLSSLAQSVSEVAQSAFDLSVYATLFYFHHNLFVAGCVIGFVFDSEIEKITEKVKLVFKAKRKAFENMVLFCAVGWAVLTSRQATRITLTLYYSCKLGCLFYQKHKNQGISH